VIKGSVDCATELCAHASSWQAAQRWLMGTVLAGLAVRMAVEGWR